MITLDYSVEPSELHKINSTDLTEATSTDLDYYMFCGNIIFRIDNAVFDACWKWVPVLDFATQLFLIASELCNSEAKTLSFTESEATIEFRKIGYYIEVTAGYASARALVSFQEFRKAAVDFALRVFNELAAKWPALERNPSFIERVNMVKSSLLNEAID